MYRHLLAVTLFACSPRVALATQPEDRRDIMQVVETFGRAIAEKDRPTFLALFFQGGVTWQPVKSNARFADVREHDPHATRAAYQSERTPAQFIQEIVENTSRTEETFDGIAIDSDGAAASVAFDFRFRRDSKVVNTGREYWLLVKTDGGWKITSVVWSNN